MAKHSIITIFCILLLTFAGFVSYTSAEAAEEEKLIEKLCENVYFEESTIENYGSIHLRGKLLGVKLIFGLAALLIELEGVVRVGPIPYEVYITKSPLYTWDEIFGGLCEKVEKLIKENRKSVDDAAMDKVGV